MAAAISACVVTSSGVVPFIATLYSRTHCQQCFTAEVACEIGLNILFLLTI